MGLTTARAESPQQLEQYVQLYDLEAMPAVGAIEIPEGVVMAPSPNRVFSLYRSMTGEAKPFTLTRSIEGAAEKIVTGEVHVLWHSDKHHLSRSDEFAGMVSAEAKKSRLPIITRTVNQPVLITVETNAPGNSAFERELCLRAIGLGLYRAANGIEPPAAETAAWNESENEIAAWNTHYDNSMGLLATGEISADEFMRRLIDQPVAA